MFNTQDISSQRFTDKVKMLLERSDDPHNIYTPLELCQEVVSKIPSLDGNILVVANLEFVYTLKRMDVSVENIYFATPCPLKANAAKSLLAEHNVFRYNGVITKKDMRDMKFDVVVGNPPYNKGLYKQFMLQATSLLANAGEFAFIVPATFLTGNGSKKFRKECFSVLGPRELTIKPVGTFTDDSDNQDALVQTVIVRATVGYTGPVVINRSANGRVFSTTISINDFEDDIWLFFGEVGKSIWDKAQAYPTRMNWESWKKLTTVPDTHSPGIHFCEKTSASYYERSGGFNVSTPNLGRVIHTGVVNNSSGQHPPTIKQVKSLRHYILTETKEQADNLYAWMGSNLYGLLLLMSGSTHNITNKTVGALPKVIVKGDFSPEKVYDALNLSLEERTWLSEIFTNDN